MDIQKFVKSEVIMKHTKMTALLCTLALSGCISATAAPQAVPPWIHTVLPFKK